MRLNAPASASTSSRSSPIATRALRSPDATRRAASAKRPIGSATRVALVSPTHIAPSNTSSAVEKYASANSHAQRAALLLCVAIVFYGLIEGAQLRDEAALDAARHREVGVVVS